MNHFQQRIIIIGALPESLINFRGELIKSLSKTATVIAIAEFEESEVITKLNNINVAFKSFPIQRNRLNPFVDFKTWWSLKLTFTKIKPTIILAYTIKPVIWGGFASRAVPESRFYALITGLGFAFQGGSLARDLLSKLVIGLYKMSLINAEKIIFQNPDNMREFISKGIVIKEKCVLVNGSGVDIQKFFATPLPKQENTIFLTIGRLLGEKGFREYVKAARIVKQKYPNVTFQLLGPKDPSPDGISIKEVARWQKEGFVDYLGSILDVRPYIQSCHIYVLPSYHEGMPRTVLEAMAIGRPILTTDVPGCRETVIAGENGYLVPKADANALAERMIWFIENRDQWERMGKRSRQLAEEKYDVHKVNAQLMEIMGL